MIELDVFDPDGDRAVILTIPPQGGVTGIPPTTWRTTMKKILAVTIAALLLAAVPMSSVVASPGHCPGYHNYWTGDGCAYYKYSRHHH